jgi:hypothetical protein
LGQLLDLQSPGQRKALLAAAASAPNLLTRSPSALEASAAALRKSHGKGTARALLAAAPQLLGYSAAALASRSDALLQLSGLSDDWRARVDAARAEPAQLSAALLAPEAAWARLRWLIEMEQRLAPGDTSLLEVLLMSEDVFGDIYPQWRAARPEA